MSVFVNGTRIYGTAEHTDFSPLAWLDQAACRDYDPLLWDTDYYETSDYDIALRVCWQCPVMRDCQDWGDRAEKGVTVVQTIATILGGETPEQRTNRRRGRNLK